MKIPIKRENSYREINISFDTLLVGQTLVAKTEDYESARAIQKVFTNKYKGFYKSKIKVIGEVTYLMIEKTKFFTSNNNKYDVAFFNAGLEETKKLICDVFG